MGSASVPKIQSTYNAAIGLERLYERQVDLVKHIKHLVNMALDRSRLSPDNRSAVFFLEKSMDELHNLHSMIEVNRSEPERRNDNEA